MYDTVGERLSYCRNMLGLSRREFVESFGKITLPTLSRWELNYIEIPMSKINNLIKFFQQNGIEVSQEWILFNRGKSPINTNLQSFDMLNFDELAFVTLSNLKNNIENFEIHQINSNFFSPVICSGDYIGGVIYKNLEMLINKLCFILYERVLSVGIFNYEHMTITNFFKQTIKIELGAKIGSVVWVAKR